MSEQKRKIAETDPDYDDAADQQAKRQRVLEQDARETACRKITSTIKKEFQREISDKENELLQIDLRLNQARLVMDRLRACVVASYYGRAHRTLSAAPSSDCSSSKVPPPNIHPTIKKFIGKAPKNVPEEDQPGPSSSSSSFTPTTPQAVDSQVKDGEPEKDESTCFRATAHVSSSSGVPSPTPRSLISTKVSKPLPHSAQGSYEDRRSRFKIKKKIVIGNVSRYIPVDQRELTDMSSHKWMVYVRGHKSNPDISGFVRKVWFFLHHSYKPNDHVEISTPPFHLTRRGWGEFPVRVQLHFVDSRNKKVDIIHHLKLDKTFTGLQKLGAETVVEVELEKDFFESVDDDEEPQQSSVPSGPRQLYTFPQKPSASSSSSSSFTSIPSSKTGSPLECQAVSSPRILSPLVSSSPLVVSEKSVTDSQSSSPSLSSSASSDCIQNKSNNETAVKTTEMSQSVTRDEGAREADCSKQPGGKTVLSHAAGTEKENNDIIDCDGIPDSDGGGILDTSWIKMETEEVVVDENSVGTDGSPIGGMFGCDTSSKVTGFIERRDDHRIVGLVDEEFNVTIKHEENMELSDSGNNMEVDVNDDITRHRVVVSSNVSEEQTTSLPYVVEANINQQTLPTQIISTLKVSQAFMSGDDNHGTVVKQQQQQQQQGLRQMGNKISILKPQVVKLGHASSSPKPQSILSQNQNPPAAGLKKLTVIDIANHQRNLTPHLSTSASPNYTAKSSPQGFPTLIKTTAESTVAPVTAAPVTAASNTTLKISHQINSASPKVSPPTSQIDVSNPDSVSSKILQVINQPQKIPSAIQPQQEKTHPIVKKVSLLPPNITVKRGPGNKVIVLKQPICSLTSSSSSSSSEMNVTSQLSESHVSPINTESSPSNTKGKKQISLLTGLVIKSARNEQAHNKSAEVKSSLVHLRNPQMNIKAVHTTLHGGDTENFVTLTKPSSHQNVQHKVNIITDQGQLFVSKNPHMVVNQSVSSPSLYKPPSSYSLLTYSSSSPSTSQVLGDKSITTPSNTILAQTSTPNIVIAYPKTTPPHVVLETESDKNVNSASTTAAAEYYNTSLGVERGVKMSAIGKTKYRGLVPRDPVEGRIWRQYQVLNDYKKSMQDCYKDQQTPTPRLYNDTIEGEQDQIPKLNPDEYPDAYSLTKAAIRLHPVIQSGVNKLTHPYCAESREQWFSWPVGKQRACEWHRACFTLKYIKDCLNGASSFKGETLMTTKQLVCWCRLHAFSPQMPIFPSPDFVVKVERDSPVIFFPPHKEIPQSFTSAADLKSRLPCLLSETVGISASDTQEVEIVFEEMAPVKVEVKEEMQDTENESTSELFPLSDGALFVHEWMRKRGVKLLTEDSTEERIAADALYKVMMEFGSDILRKALAVHSEREKSSDGLVVQDIHSALCSLPIASFCCNSYLGKEEEEEDESGGSHSSR